MNNVKYPVLVVADSDTFKVVGEFDSSSIDSAIKFEDGRAYLDIQDNHAWVYSESKPKNYNRYPYFWIEGNEFAKSSPSPEIFRLFSSSKFMEYSPEYIMHEADKTGDKQLFNDQLIDDMSASSEIFHPMVYAKDDFLKKIVKTVINTLNISLSKLKHKLDQKYMISNMKSAMMSTAKMSTMYFNAWAELLGLKFTIIIESKDDAEDKLNEPFIYVSDRDAIFKLSEAQDDFKFPDLPNSDNN